MIIQQLILSVVNFVAFLLLLTCLWFLPGTYLFKNKDRLGILDFLLLSTVFGFAIFSITLFIFRLLHLPIYLAYLPFLVLSFGKLLRIKKISLKKIKIQPIHITLLVTVITGALLQGIVLSKSALQSEGGLAFLEISAHDSLQHVFLINDLKNYFPPREPGFAPYLVKNYHFLLDLILASMVKYLPLSTFELYYRVTPFFVTFLFGISVFVFTRKITKSDLAGNIAVALALFSGNAAWIFKFFRGPEFRVSANSFMLDPLMDLMQNPIAVLVFPLMLTGILGMFYLDQKFNWRWLFLSGICFGVLFGFKTWGGVLMLIALPIYALFLTIKQRKNYGWMLFSLTLLVSLLIFLPIYDRQTAANPIFTPGWLLKRMVEDPDRYNFLQYYFLEQHYRSTGNLFGLVKINTLEIIIFLFGNLWLNSLGFLYILRSFKKISPYQIFAFFVIAASLSLPLLFNQGRKSYDIVQFGPYALVLMSIFTAAFLHNIKKYLNNKIYVFMVLIFIALSFPSNIHSLISRYKSEKILISKDEIQAYDYIRQKTNQESTIMVYPSQRNDATLLVAALTQRPTYFSGKSFAEITGRDIKQRSEKWMSFFKNIDPEQRRKIINEGNINYLVLKTAEDKLFNPAGIDLENVFSNQEMVIYRIK